MIYNVILIAFTGKIDFEPNSVAKEEAGIKKSPNIFSLSTSRRIFFMYPDKPEEVKGWIDAINLQISKGGIDARTNSSSNLATDSTGSTNSSNPSSTSSTTSYDSKTPNGPTSSPISSSPPQSTSSSNSKPEGHPPAAFNDMSPRVRLALAKGVVNFLKEQDSKVLEFWQIWSESIPAREDLGQGMCIEFQVATSADMQKLTWRTSGPQNIFIQKMVDFFWNVGAPESEIDRLHDVGALINPLKIGSWIDMSAKGGMDGGWFFPVDIPLKLSVESADSGDAIKKFVDWAESHGISNVYAVGRDMGAAPPRQTELKMKVPGGDFMEQLNVGMSAFESFGFPPVPDNAYQILKTSKPEGNLSLSVITSSEGFVRVGLLVPFPTTEIVVALCNISGGNHEELASFEASLGRDCPSYVEYQYLMKNFGYGVYKEGFDIVFHYAVGEEVSE